MGVRGKDPVEREKGAFVSRKNFSHVLLACGIVCALVFGEAEILWHDVMLPAFQRSLQVLLPPNLSPEPALYVDSGEIYDKNTMRAKPVIYLYPEQKTDVRVRLDYRGVWERTYPEYAGGWSVTAYPDGKLVNHADGGEYPYLFWEGRDRVEYDFSRGFVVRGEDTARFLRAKLEYMGLTPAEYNEFIVYWYPRMRDNPYNLIAFQGKTYTDYLALTVTPRPDSVLRVCMAYRRLHRSIEVPPQQLNRFERKGFAVVEWSGAEVR